MSTMIVIVLVVSVLTAFLLGRYLKISVDKTKIRDAKAYAASLVQEAEKEADNIKKAKVLEAKDELYRSKQDQEREIRHRRKEIIRLEKQISFREANMDRKADLLKKREYELSSLQQDIIQREKSLDSEKKRLYELIDEEVQQLENISCMTKDDAKNVLMTQLIEQAKQDSVQIMKDIRDQARVTAHREAKELIVQAIQRTAAEHAVETTVSVVQLPNDEMKGRIIGREGRNIRAFEMATGVEVIVDDTPEAVLISCFEPIRREIAKIALEKLITDGRIHPGRIEDVVIKAKEEIKERIIEAGEQAAMETGVHGLGSELIKALGRLKFRSTYGQNVLQHSIEVAHLAGYMALELGLDSIVAKRAGLLHDIGKSIDAGKDISWAKLGMELAKKCEEGPIVQNAIASFDNKTPIISPITVLVHAANNISKSRPGAKRETLEDYIQRLHKLEKLAEEMDGVQRAFVIQAGREIRIIVDPGKIDDLQADQLAVDISNRIKEEMEYPGQIKITVIREFRIVDYAK